MKSRQIFCLIVAVATACSQDVEPSTKVVEFPVSQVVDETAVEFTGFTREGAYLDSHICYKARQGLEWFPDQVTLVIQGQEIGPYLTSTNPATSRPGFSCGSISFPVGVEQDLGELVFTVGQLTTRPNFDDCEGAQAKLDEANTGIVIICAEDLFSNTDQSTAEGFSLTTTGFGVSKWPPWLTSQEASKIAKQAFSSVIEGPWIFIFVVGIE